MTETVHARQYVEIVARLRAIRRGAGVSQSALARRLARPQSYVSKVETAERRLDVLELIDLCGALGVRLVDVLPPELQRKAGLVDT
jgi:transcriptional regulator with XRE-family HTH domain